MTMPTHGSSAAVALGLEAPDGADLRTILLLDPVTLFLRYEETVLQRRDWRIHCARTASEATELLEREHVDLLVMDHVLPDARGDELIRAIRSNPRTRATGILVLTARGGEAEVAACLEAGANGVVHKPVTRQALCARVEDLLFVAARRHVRTLVRLRVDARAGGTFLFGNTVNVSAGGMLLESGTCLDAGETIDVNFSLPGEAEPILAHARVVRRQDAAESGRYSVALAFEGMADADRTRLDAFVTATREHAGATLR